ncbi:hypothetical protein M378DRAFT_165030 [Amanita muscaria Koide BX008]|uniref:Uncharacterized protein n=1 Tax=Amanita muscaria (strain Koide BX008) TaxID=946122 RepID=A0A0C2T8L0_AMAMK|nr:hypothetical protein M378DRAFT_165030 [Amanita muscaria Koide BX008]
MWKHQDGAENNAWLTACLFFFLMLQTAILQPEIKLLRYSQPPWWPVCCQGETEAEKGTMKHHIQP